MRYFLLLFMFWQGCSPCKGVYTERDDEGVLKKYNEHKFTGISGCVTDTVPLNQWDSSLEARIKKGVSCKPQPTSKTLIAQNNFYAYRDGKLYLDLNASTGEYRRLTLAEGKDGKQVYTRLQGCYYERSGQLMLDTDLAASDQAFDPVEIFTFTESSTNSVEMIRFDDSVDWDYRFCPYLDTPWGVCDLLKAPGNDMFFPNLTPTEKTSLLNDAILIRRQFNYVASSLAQFNGLWNSQDRTPEVREDYKYAVQTIVDTPRYIDQAWMEYIKYERPVMPDLSSSRMPELCYNGKRTVTLSDGSSSTIYGQICYVDGQYSFTQ